jgi:hypothetical protein
MKEAIIWQKQKQKWSVSPKMTRPREVIHIKCQYIDERRSNL